MLLGLGRVLLAFGMLIPAMRLGGGAMGLCSGLVKFGRLVVWLFHFDFRWNPCLSGLETAV